MVSLLSNFIHLLLKEKGLKKSFFPFVLFRVWKIKKEEEELFRFGKKKKKKRKRKRRLIRFISSVIINY